MLKGVIAGYIQKDGGKVKQFFSRRAIVNGGGRYWLMIFLRGLWKNC